MSIPILNLSYPYESIFRTTLNYSEIKVFGCFYYLWLRSYASNKLDNHSKPCVFFRYSLLRVPNTALIHLYSKYMPPDMLDL